MSKIPQVKINFLENIDTMNLPDNYNEFINEISDKYNMKEDEIKIFKTYYLFDGNKNIINDEKDYKSFMEKVKEGTAGEIIINLNENNITCQSIYLNDFASNDIEERQEEVSKNINEFTLSSLILDSDPSKNTGMNFEIYCNKGTNIGENIGILGNIKILGNWSINHDKNEIFKLNWDNNCRRKIKWTGKLTLPNEINNFEFKFVLWYNKKEDFIYENGRNRIIDIERIKNNNSYFSQYKYDKSENKIILDCRWQN